MTDKNNVVWEEYLKQKEAQKNLIRDNLISLINQGLENYSLREDKEAFLKPLKELVHMNGRGQTALQANLAISHMHSILNGRVNPSFVNMLSILKTLDLTIQVQIK